MALFLALRLGLAPCRPGGTSPLSLHRGIAAPLGRLIALRRRQSIVASSSGNAAPLGRFGHSSVEESRAIHLASVAALCTTSALAHPPVLRAPCRPRGSPAAPVCHLPAPLSVDRLPLGADQPPGRRPCGSGPRRSRHRAVSIYFACAQPRILVAGSRRPLQLIAPTTTPPGRAPTLLPTSSYVPG